jgi:hypothetical protein
MPEPWLLIQGGVHVQMNGLVLKKVVTHGTPPLKRIGKDLKWISWWKYFCVFIKRKDKRYKYEDELGSSKIVIVPRQQC